MTAKSAVLGLGLGGVLSAAHALEAPPGGALGDFFYAKKRSIKMGDAPSVLYLLRGDPARPASEHWGGSFVATGHGPDYWHDDPDRALKEKGKKGARTVSKWRESYLRDWQARMDWCRGPRASGPGRGEGASLR